MMENHIKEMLLKQQIPENILKLRNDIRSWLRMSRMEMKKRYGTWDYNLRTFREKRMFEMNDRDARKNAEPTKMTVPMSYTQVMTYVTFSYLLMKQNDVFFELEGNQNGAYTMTEASEDMLERDLRHNYWSQRLLQSLLDVARFGLCAFKTTWKTETVMVNVPLPASQYDNGNFTEATAPEQQWQEVTKYEGNNIINVSPYRLLPDMRFPLSRWKEGRFVADEYEYNIRYLKDLEQKGILAGTEFITRTTKDLFISGRTVIGGWEQNRFEIVNAFLGMQAELKDDFMCISTEGHFKIVPADYDLGPETHACDYLVQVVNDERIVRLERMEYMHQEFIYDIGMFMPDMHIRLGMAMVDPIAALQEVITFMVNARVISLRQGLERHIVYDPSVIDTRALESRSPGIPLRKGAPRNGIQNYIVQLRYQDPTQQNMQEMEMFQQIMETVTGVNKNAMGQYSPGRRSATENRSANQGAASRMLLHTNLLWDDCYGPMGRKMLTNLRQGISFDTFQKVIGPVAPTPGIDINALYQQFCPQDRTQLVGNEQFFVFNGTTQSERAFTAQSLQELVQALMGNPQIMPLLGYDLTKLVDEIQRLRGIRNLSRFKVAPGPDGTPNPMAASLAPLLSGAQPAGPGGVPIQANAALPNAAGGVQGGAG